MKTKLISLLILSLAFALHADQKIKRTWAKACPDCGTVVLSSKVVSNGGYTKDGQNWRWVSVQFRCPHCKDGITLGNFTGKLPDEIVPETPMVEITPVQPEERHIVSAPIPPPLPVPVQRTNQSSLLGTAGTGPGKPVKSYEPPLPIPSPKKKAN